MKSGLLLDYVFLEYLATCKIDNINRPIGIAPDKLLKRAGPLLGPTDDLLLALLIILGSLLEVGPEHPLDVLECQS